MKQISISLLLMLLFACNKQPGTSVDKVTTSQDLSTVDSIIQVFNEYIFKGKADTIISDILGTQTAFSKKIDTIRPDVSSLDKRMRTIPQYIALHSKELLHYRYILPEPHSGLSLDVYVATIKSQTLSDTVFSYLRYLSLDEVGDTITFLQVPGLTYENDYVLKLENAIIWLNSNCLYSFENHMKFARGIRQSLGNKNIQDSILCKCGAVKCN